MRKFLFAFVIMFAVSGIADAANRAPLKPQPYRRLPMGSVHARTWLKYQLELQRDGLTGHAEELYDDIGKSKWLTGGKGRGSWERGPYYAKGLLSLAYVLDDQGLKDKAQRWVEGVIKSQRDTGDFGPRERNWWANMIVLYYMRDYHEATKDERALEFLKKYFAFQLKTLPEHPLKKDSGWAAARGGDNLDVVLWLYNITGDKSLIDLAKLIIGQTNEWHRLYVGDWGGRKSFGDHIVNTQQGLKATPLMYLVTGEDVYKNGFASAFDSKNTYWKNHGRVDGMISGTERLDGRSSTTGTELCAIVERIFSNAIALQILGDAYIGDQTERVAYNCLPASLAHDIKGLRYYILPNQPKCTNEDLGFRENGRNVNSICPSPHSGFGCCRSEFHMGWPKFVHNMWMATADGGLAVAVYGPNEVTAEVAKGKKVKIEQITDYPFKSDITLKVTEGEKAFFPLELRIPGWCKEPVVKVNGKAVEDVKPNTFHRVERKWKKGDKVTLNFPMPIKTSHWMNNSIALTRGPLVYSLLIEENEWKTTKSYLDGKFHTREITPKSAWNYALLLKDEKNPEVDVKVSKKMPVQPFKASDAPVRIKLKGFKTEQDGWGGYMEKTPARAKEPPKSPMQTKGDSEDIILIPYGSTEIRITLFPWAKK